MSVPWRSRETVFGSRHRIAGSVVALSLAGGVLAACGNSGGVPTLTWYINPDSGGQAAVAAACTSASNGAYKIVTQTLPQDANQQRVQLARRLAAHDSGIDLMSIDPPYTAELSNAGFLAPIPASEQQVAQGPVVQGRDRTRPRGTASWSPTRSGPTRRCSGTASRSWPRPAST